MNSFRERDDERRNVFLSFSGSIGSQLRDEFAKKNADGAITQSSLGEKLGVNRSVIHRRLTGQCNMTEETIADMVWALGCCIKVEIFDPSERPEINHPLAPELRILSALPVQTAANDTLPPRKPVTASRIAQITMSKLQMAQ